MTDKKPGIRNLSSKQARNLMRGVIAKPNSLQAYQALARIYTENGESEFRQAIEVFRENPLFRNNAIGRNFNKKLPRPVGQEALTAFKPSFIYIKIEHNQKKLSELIKLCQCVLHKIGGGELFDAFEACKALQSKNGASITLVKYLYFIKNHSTDRALLESIDEFLREISINNARYISNAIRELTSEKTDYLNIAEKISNAERSIGTVISRSFIETIPRTEQIYSETLSSLYQFSLFDAYLYAARLQDFQLPYVEELDSRQVEETQRLNETQFNFDKLYPSKDNSIGIQAFREAFLLEEIDTLYKYRVVHQCLFNTLEAKEDKRTPYENQLLREYFRSVDSIKSIGSPTEQTENHPTKICTNVYQATSACHFQNSTALTFILERKDAQIEDEELDFVKAMSITRDIGLILPSQHIEQIKIQAKSNELKIVATALSHIKQRGQLKEHELRSILQAFALSDHNGKLLELLEHIYAASPAVAEHLIQTMDETFLNKLFGIIKNPNHAIQERANVLEWYGNKVGDTSFVERAKNLRIDVQINKERGTIDDSRIYVDPVKFTQWVSDNILTDFALLLENLPRPVEAQVLPIAWEKAKTGISTHEQLASLILLCFEEFCSNSIYGIASYLGRRIRHGTLKGTGYSDIKNIANNARYSLLFENREFEENFRNWINSYEKTLDELRDRYLHIQSKAKSDGLISREFRTVSKRMAASHMLHDILKSYSTNRSCIEVPYIILEYCWRIVEEDLSNIRRFLMEKKSQNAIFRCPQSQALISPHRELQEFTKEVNSLTADKFRAISSWFNKPSIASPSADVVLLFRAVVSEIRSHFPDYRPQVTAAEEHFILDGGAYFVIYDALFILIYNAAERGRPDGQLNLNIHLNEGPGGKNVSITISSEIRNEDILQNVMQSVNSALEGDCEDALVVEGRSGIKKLKRMEQEGNIDEVNYRFSDRTVHASFSFKINY